MSGFAALVAPPGSPSPPSGWERVAEVMEERGPDRRDRVIRKGMVLAHALLASDPLTARETLPLTLDGRHWVTGDIRLDDREGLADRLGLRENLPALTDGHLLLHAYRRWGREMPAHLLGDYAFVVAEPATGECFGARDPFGMKLFYHAEGPWGWAGSNTLAALLALPPISDDLDEEVVGDFLLNRIHPEDRTFFRHLRALPRGHTLHRTPDGRVSVRPFWSPPEEPPLPPFRDTPELLEGFQEKLGLAVRDRVRGGAVTLSLSGGVDSPLMAAEAAAAGSPSVRGVTVTLSSLLPDEEEGWARMAAEHLGIGHTLIPLDEAFRNWGWLEGVRACEPSHLFSVGYLSPLRTEAVRHAPLAFTGFDGDALLAYDRRALFRARVAHREWRSLARELLHHRPGSRLAPWEPLRAWRRRRDRAEGHAPPPFPRWIQPDFAGAFGLRERWMEPAFPPTPATSRGPTLAGILSPNWRSTIEEMDPGITGSPLEFRHPLADLRLVEYALSLPPLPWCSSKEMLRRAAFGRLPEALVRRPKRPVPGNPLAAGVATPTFRLTLPSRLPPELERFVDPRALTAIPEEEDLLWTFHGAFTLAAWMKVRAR